MGRGDRAINQQRLGRTADSGPAHFRIEDNRPRHREVGSPVDIDVTIAVEMRKHRHPRFRLHTGDEPLAAARHDDINRAV
jgi:hypothetical protein